MKPTENISQNVTNNVKLMWDINTKSYRKEIKCNRWQFLKIERLVTFALSIQSTRDSSSRRALMQILWCPKEGMNWGSQRFYNASAALLWQGGPKTVAQMLGRYPNYQSFFPKMQSVSLSVCHAETYKLVTWTLRTLEHSNFSEIVLCPSCALANFNSWLHYCITSRKGIEWRGPCWPWKSAFL